ncbi:tetratricopeptide repeat protein [Olivibacter sp. XZL3]|uniref:tetratricopeptide repeat protein n=1 Tax=Olivibacter sp. XZL3 TaxID=1735116 RepID=UPI00106672C8|nr:tetratricopeptide repeat protein [Olivibacter sp. XZL3]
MHKTKQIIVIALVVVLMGVLMAQPIKGLVKRDNTEQEQEATTNTETEAVNLASVSTIAKQGLNANLTKEIAEVEAALSNSSGEERLNLLKKLAGHWDDVAKPAPLGFTYEEIAKLEPSHDNWLKAGDAFTAAYENLQDTVLAPALTQHAQQAYQKALDLNPKSLDAKAGLGTAIVNIGGAPMQGIALLMEVVKEDPKNLKANTSLGMFSMRSRQFDKAVDRFKTVIEIQPSAEAWFYLATSYENIGLKAEAIKAFQQSKTIAADPSLSQFIDRKIDELNK